MENNVQNQKNKAIGKPVTVCQVLFEIFLFNKKWYNNKAEKRIISQLADM